MSQYAPIWTARNTMKGIVTIRNSCSGYLSAVSGYHFYVSCFNHIETILGPENSFDVSLCWRIVFAFEYKKLSNQSNLSLFSLYYVRQACSEFMWPISATLRTNNTTSSEEISQRWRAVGNTVSNLTGLWFEPQISRSIDECVTSRPTGQNFSPNSLYSCFNPNTNRKYNFSFSSYILKHFPIITPLR